MTMLDEIDEICMNMWSSLSWMIFELLFNLYIKYWYICCNKDLLTSQMHRLRYQIVRSWWKNSCTSWHVDARLRLYWTYPRSSCTPWHMWMHDVSCIELIGELLHIVTYVDKRLGV